MDRRNSDRDDRRSPSPPRNPNVFDDEYALDPDEDDFMPTVSDGFRPTGMGAADLGNSDRQDHDRNLGPTRPPLMTNISQESDLRRIASRNSTMKTPGDSIPHDPRNPGTHTRGAVSQATTGLQHRESISSTGSFATMARSDSPLTSGPSHPYGMYTQNTMARSLSVATTSTTQQPHRSLSLSRPAHPYGMYTQNVVEDDEPPLPAAPAPAAIPVGFPGLNNGYHRRLGPDGEEQDIVGPDGHMEQLPPYTRYPTEGPIKAAMVAEANATPVEPSSPDAFDDARAITTPVSPISTLQNSPVQEPQDARRRSPGPVSTSAAAITTATAVPTVSPQSTTTTLPVTEHPMSEKQEELGRRGKNWRSKKLWGKIPMSIALLMLILVIVFAIILGAAIGTFVAKNKDKSDRKDKHGKDREEPSPQVTGAPRSLFDATPIPTPSSLPPLPTGDFALPLGIAQESSPSCLTLANQLSAWSCKMTFAPLVLRINNTVGKDEPPTVSLDAFTKPDGGIQYGVQPPLLSDRPIPMQLVLDLDYKAYGPAFHFAARYDKVVVLSQDEFAAGAALTPRQASETPTKKPPFRHRFQVLPGDEPWFCVWNKTYIEGYIYATDNSTAATFSAFPTAWPSVPYGSSVPVESATGVIPMDTASPMTTNEGQGPPTTGSTPMPTPVARYRRGDGDYPRYPPYPRIVKIEERRLPGSPQPYCQKMRLYDNGQLLPATTASGQQIKISLQEDDPTFEEFFTASSTSPDADTSIAEKKRSLLQKRRDPPGACHCQWMFQ